MGRGEGLGVGGVEGLGLEVGWGVETASRLSVVEVV